MSERLRPLRLIVAYETERHYFLVAKEPFDKSSEEFDYLSFIASEVRELEEGSQVFVYERRAFGMPEDQWEGIRGYMYELAEEAGSIAVYPNIRSLY